MRDPVTSERFPAEITRQATKLRYRLGVCCLDLEHAADGQGRRGLRQAVLVGALLALAGGLAAFAEPTIVDAGQIQLVGKDLCLNAGAPQRHSLNAYANGTNIRADSCGYPDSEYETITLMSNGWLKFPYEYAGGAHKCFDVADAGTSNGTNVQVWDCSDLTNQKWDRVGSTFRPRHASDMCLDVNAPGEGKVGIWQCLPAEDKDAGNQQWKIAGPRRVESR